MATEVIRNNNDWIQTYTGRKFWAFEPSVFDVHIEDIAHALAMKCRYAGHCKEFYSVAQHSTIMAQIVYAGPLGCYNAFGGYTKAQLAMWALLHDATEAYLPDVPRPQKHRLYVWCPDLSTNDPDILYKRFAECEDRLMTTIALALDLQGVEIPREIKHLDSRLLNTERQQLFNDPIEWGSMKDFPIIEGIEIESHSWNVAKANFLGMYSVLKHALKHGM